MAAWAEPAGWLRLRRSTPQLSRAATALTRFLPPPRAHEHGGMPGRFDAVPPDCALSGCPAVQEAEPEGDPPGGAGQRGRPLGRPSSSRSRATSTAAPARARRERGAVSPWWVGEGPGEGPAPHTAAPPPADGSAGAGRSPHRASHASAVEQSG